MALCRIGLSLTSEGLVSLELAVGIGFVQDYDFALEANIRSKFQDCEIVIAPVKINVLLIRHMVNNCINLINLLRL